MYIGGAGVARGYLNRPELTAERFVASPFVDGDRLYKTGDLARYLADGTIEFLGRNDFQVKIRGFRIELGEIEARLSQQPGVGEAVVVAREDETGEKRLVAYYTARDDDKVTADSLRTGLLLVLPAYMVPAAYVEVEVMPLTPNGKLDRRALPAPDGSAYVRGVYEPPQGVLEESLAQIWCEVLKVERVGRHDNFFELGGHSLLAVRLLSRVQQDLNLAVSLTDIFSRPVLCNFAQGLGSAERLALPPIPVVGRDEALPLSFAQERLWFLSQMDGISNAYHIPLGLHLEGALDRGALRSALDRIVARHEALRTTFVSIDGRPMQKIAPPETGFHLVEHDLGGSAQWRNELAAIAAQEARAPFDLAMGPLIRGRLLRVEDQSHILLITMHHIVSDGWSMGILLEELRRCYAAYRDGQGDALEPLSVQYADYAAWQRRWLSGEVLQRQTAYWRQTFADSPALLELPTDRPRPAVQDLTGGACRLEA